jgi:tetratricopeptide (TPR) repeat protein
MSSIIEGYNYDIFISYRQKDNKGDRWVSEFVEALKTELESTFKEEISVYFDINPHDGLLETHDVDASLKDKLKCLVFIPIISRTYCDPKSFAWEHEFKAFVEQASKDQFGLKVKLPNGNVASRVLPVRIHDLDAEDMNCFEGITGGVMRTLDFVFKTASGVNRPLKSKEDHPGDNLNKTYYQDQINKVSLAIKEIIQGMKTEPRQVVKEKGQPKESAQEIWEDERRVELEKPVKLVRHRWLSVAVVVALLLIAIILAYHKIFKQETLELLRSSGERISVAVMPFQNMSNDTIWNVWQSGIQDIIVTYLSNSPEELKVRQTESINGLIQSRGFNNYASITPSVARNLSKKLGANIFVYGSINQSGATIRINAKLTDSRTVDIVKSFQVDGTIDRILPLIDSLSRMISKFLIITKLGKDVSPDFQSIASTNSPEAYRYLIYGDNAFFIKRDYPSATKFYSQAVAIDSNFIAAIIKLSWALYFQGLYDEAKKCVIRTYHERDHMSMQQKLFVNYAYASIFETPYDEIKYLKQVLEFDDQMPFVLESISYSYEKLLQYDKEIPGYEKALKIYKEWDSKPPWIFSYTQLGTAYHKTGQYNKERKLYKKAEHDFPDDPLLIRRQAILSLSEGDTISANDYIKNYISISKERSVSDATIVNNLALTYEDAGILNKAEEYYRQALSLEPENSIRMNNLAWFLIDKDRNIVEGLKLIDEALELSPDSYYMLDTKGWGLYKKGNFKQALELIEKSDSLKPIYSHELYLHLEEVKKAVASQKNN